jgi:hypothetical protein
VGSEALGLGLRVRTHLLRLLELLVEHVHLRAHHAVRHPARLHAFLLRRGGCELVDLVQEAALGHVAQRGVAPLGDDRHVVLQRHLTQRGEEKLRIVTLAARQKMALE